MRRYTEGVTFLPSNAALGATNPPNSLAPTDALSLSNMEMQIAHDFSSGGAVQVDSIKSRVESAYGFSA